MTNKRYSTAQAFQRALETRITATATGGDLLRLRREIAFDRFLARLFHQPDPPWILKGGYAMELRLHNRARVTKDLDLTIPHLEWLRQHVQADQTQSVEDMILDAMRQVAEIDVDDFFEFRVSKPVKSTLTGAPQGGLTCSVECRLDKREFITFRLDVGVGDAIIGSTDWLSGQPNLSFSEIPAPYVGLIPLAQHFAEKVHAYTLDWGTRTNTRDKDLVDMVLMLENEQLDVDEVRQALLIIFAHRAKQPLPGIMPEPPPSWAKDYATAANELGLSANTLDSAYQLIAKFWEECHLK